MAPRIQIAIAVATLAMALLGNSWPGAGWGLATATLPLPAAQGDIALAGAGHGCPGGAMDETGNRGGAPELAGCCIAFCQMATLAAAPALSPVRPAPATGPLAGTAPPVSWPPPLRPPQA